MVCSPAALGHHRALHVDQGSIVLPQELPLHQHAMRVQWESSIKTQAVCLSSHRARFVCPEPTPSLLDSANAPHANLESTPLPPVFQSPAPNAKRENTMQARGGPPWQHAKIASLEATPPVKLQPHVCYALLERTQGRLEEQSAMRARPIHTLSAPEPRRANRVWLSPTAHRLPKVHA